MNCLTISDVKVLYAYMKTAILGLGAVALFAFAPVADASNYYYPSVGHQQVYTPVYSSYTTPNYGYGLNLSQGQLADQLRLLIIQLQSQISSYPSNGYYNGSYGHKYNYVIGEPRSNDYDDDDDDYNDDDEPEVETDSATDIEDDEARLRGSVDMNDFEDGEVFFVFGTDEEQVEDVQDDFDSYGDVDTDGEDLRKVHVDSSLDDDEDYEVRVAGLDEDTRYYFSICVGYEDEDDDEVLACDSVDDFTTDDN